MSAMPHTGLPLDGIRVVEFTHMVMGSPAWRHDPRRPRRRGADQGRAAGRSDNETLLLPGLGMGFFRSFNRNKKSVVLDLHSVDGLAAARKLVGQCDVVSWRTSVPA